MIQFDKVSLSFQGHFLFENASFTIQKGERCGLIGRNGSGKSTLLRLIVKELEADCGAVSIPKNYKIGYLNQHIHFTMPTLLEEAALGLPPDQSDQFYLAERILFGLGFTKEDLDCSPSQFSGGYQLRLHLAKVLISEPDCLLLDEPTNYLDILSIRWLKNFLSKWPGEFILISHDRDFMDQVTTHTIAIHRQRLKKLPGTTINLLEHILIEEEVHEKARAKSEKRRSHLQSFIDRFGAKASKAKQAQARVKRLSKEPVLEKLANIAELSFLFNEADFTGKKMIEITDLSFSYGDEPLIENFNLSLHPGEGIAIIGKNGQGKSTLLRLIGGELEPLKGKVSIVDNVKIGYFGQTHIQRLNPNISIFEEIATANTLLNQTDVKSIAGVMMFSDILANKKISVLSGGEKSRVLIAKIIAKPCNLLLLDEPTHHLDIESIEALIEALEEFTGSFIIVTHSELILRRLNLTKIIICQKNKQTVFLGTYDEFLEKRGWEEEGKPKAAAKNTNMDRKERADLVQKRSAHLKPIQQQIQKVEEQIAHLEKEHLKDQQAYQKNPQNVDLIKKMGVRQKEIDTHESKLYELYERLEKAKKEFDSL